MPFIPEADPCNTHYWLHSVKCFCDNQSLDPIDSLFCLKSFSNQRVSQSSTKASVFKVNLGWKYTRYLQPESECVSPPIAWSDL